jgi:heme A synthase
MADDLSRAGTPQRNLKQSLIALGLLILSGVVGFLSMDLFTPDTNQAIVFMMAGLGFFLMILAVVYAVITLTRAIKDLNENKSSKNQGAVAICILVLALVTYELFSRLMF